jgi:hypothetical protein
MESETPQNRADSKAYENYLAILFKRCDDQAQRDTDALTDEQVRAIMSDSAALDRWENGEDMT